MNVMGDMPQSVEAEGLSKTAGSHDVAQARTLIETISREHGYVEDKFWEGLSPETQAAFRYALERKDEMIASSVSTWVNTSSCP